MWSTIQIQLIIPVNDFNRLQCSAPVFTMGGGGGGGGGSLASHTPFRILCLRSGKRVCQPETKS